MENAATTEGTGKRYDVAIETMSGVTTAPTLRGAGRNIDGFFRPRASTIPRTAAKPVANSIATLAAMPLAPSAPEISTAAVAQIKPVTQPVASRNVNHTRAHAPQPSHSRAITVSHTGISKHQLIVRRGPANHVRHHTTQRSQTLRRDSVPAPQPSTHNLLNPKSTLQHAVPSLIATKKSVMAIDTNRLARASSASKSPLVARHATPVRSILPTFTSVAVQPDPATTPVVPPPAPGGDGVPPAPQPGNKSVDIFEHALAKADHFVDLQSHKASYRKKARFHVASMLAGSLALIVIATVIAYQNSPVMQLKVASTEAGLSTHMPDFAAAGFSYNGVQASNSKLTFGFRGNTGTYQLTQTNTNLSDADMIQSIGSTTASGTPMYQVIMAGNTVVYRFNNTNATWVSNGMWYTVSGSNILSDQQVKSIVQHA